jgi:hypothetical protein
VVARAFDRAEIAHFVIDAGKTKRLGHPSTDELKSVRYIGVRTDVSVDYLLCR